MLVRLEAQEHWLPGCWFLLCHYWESLSCAMGRDQAFVPEFIEQRLAVGMSLAEVEYSLAIPPESTRGVTVQRDSGEFAVKLSDSGLGSWVVPQNAITLLFDRDGRLERCIYKVHWRLDSIDVPIRLEWLTDRR